MKDIMKLYEEARTELKNIGIDTPENLTVKVNIRAVRRYGQCRYKNGKAYEINLSARILEDYVSEDITKGVIIHELLHAVTVGEHHGGRWLKLANEVSIRYPQYNIKRTGSDEAYGLRPMQIKPKYEVQCTKCGTVGKYMRMTKAVAHPELFRCRCGGDIKRIA